MAAEEYDYGKLLEKVDSTIAQSTTAAAPVSTSAYLASTDTAGDFPSKPALSSYIKSQHTVTRLYRTNVDLIGLPQSIFILALGLFVQLFICIELVRAGVGGFGVWFLDVLVWQPILLTTHHLIAKRVPFCWPLASTILLVFFIIWDTARVAMFADTDDAELAMALGLLGMVTNFAVEIPVLVLRHKLCWQVGAVPASQRSHSDTRGQVGMGGVQSRDRVSSGAGAFVPPAPSAGATGAGLGGGRAVVSSGPDLEVAGDL